MGKNVLKRCLGMVMTALGIVVMTALGRRNRIFVGCRNLEQYLVVVILVKSVDDNAIGVIKYILESTTRLLSMSKRAVQASYLAPRVIFTCALICTYNSNMSINRVGWVGIYTLDQHDYN